jgi:rhodanese-related sulfurtransferase
MILTQYYLGCLAHASYLIADEQTGTAVVVDPQRDTAQYDDTLVYPAHGAGSLCGKNMSKETVSPLGAQKRYNYALQPMSNAAFIRLVTADQLDAPAYFAYDAMLNRRERPTLEAVLAQELQPLSLDAVLRLRNSGAQVLDVRDPADFEGTHLAGSINIGLGGAYASWAGTILERERPIVLIAEPGRETEAAMRLGRIGFDGVVGYLEGGMQALEMRPDLLWRTERITAVTLAEQLAAPQPPWCWMCARHGNGRRTTSPAVCICPSVTCANIWRRCHTTGAWWCTARAATARQLPRAFSNSTASRHWRTWWADSSPGTPPTHVWNADQGGGRP